MDEVNIPSEPIIGNPSQSVETCIYRNDVAPDVVCKTVLDPVVIEQIVNVLSSRFANGFRLKSPIEMARFRAFVAKDVGEDITLADEDLKAYILACGTVYGGKVYAVSTKTKEQIKGLAEHYFAEGAQVIFFAEFYAKNEDWLFGANVVSEEMLVHVLEKLFPELSFTQTYFGHRDASIFTVLESEILRVWGDDVVLTYGQLAERLKYIPFERIKTHLSQNGDFVWSCAETFSHVSRIEIPNEKKQVICKITLGKCNAQGYASVIDLPFADTQERYFDLSTTAIHEAVYRICLLDEFDKRGKIITRKGDTVDALSIIKRYCRANEKCSLDDMLALEKELTGGGCRWIPLEAGNATMVRIDKNTYVSDRHVQFEVGVVDDAIGRSVLGNYLPLKSFTTFGAFPDCGQQWNLYLLESYCRRFSKKFRLDSPSVNSRNVGVVVRKSCGLDYTEIMINAVAKSDVLLEKAAVGKFLYENGYTGRRTTVKANAIIDKAKTIRKGRD